MGIISKIGTTHLTAAQKGEAVTGSANSVKSPSYHGHSVPPSLTTAALSGHLASEPPSGGSSSSPEQTLKRQSLECLVSTLRSLVAWGTAPGKGVADPSLSDQVGTRSRTAEESQTESLADLPPESKSASSVPEIARISTPELVDDPTRFESAKLLKTTLIEGIKKFNFKPKRVRKCSPPQTEILWSHLLTTRQGIKFLVDAGFVPSQKPHDIAYFLLHTEGLSKAMIGEYLGEG
jgi:brefeldin A-inhibited guanine nucleotide-exchange protein